MKCNACGTVLNIHGCLNCGAPVCCSKCCADDTATTREIEAEVTKPCVCGEPATPGVVHRTDGPCYMAEAGKGEQLMVRLAVGPRRANVGWSGVMEAIAIGTFGAVPV